MYGMSLTEASYYFRKIAPFAILGGIVIFIIYYGIQLIILLVQLQQPPATPVSQIVNPVFGAIPRPIIANATPSAGLTYILDTIDGVTVSASPAANVYFLPKAPARLGFKENVFLMAKNLDVNTELANYERQGDSAVFTDAKNRFVVDVNSYNFDYEYLYLANENERLAEAYIPSADTINEKAVEILSKVGRYPAELARGKRNIVYLAFNPQTDELTVVDKPENANLVEVDFYREDIDSLPAASPRYYNSPNYLVLLFDNQGHKVVKAKVSFFDRSTEQIGVYPLKTGDQAWEEFTSGNGYIVSGGDGLSQVNIKRMFVAYFDPDVAQDYLQPIYVFMGENNFVGYTPALTNEYLIEATPSARPTIEFNEPEPLEPTQGFEELNPEESSEEAEIEEESSVGSATPPESPTPTKKSSGVRVKTLAPTASPTP